MKQLQLHAPAEVSFNEENENLISVSFAFNALKKAIGYNGLYLPAELFNDHKGTPIYFRRGHTSWEMAPSFGIGKVDVVNGVAIAEGEYNGTTVAAEMKNEVALCKKYGMPIKASIAFSYSWEEVLFRQDLNKRVRDAGGTWSPEKIRAVNHVAFVERPNFEGAQFSFNELNAETNALLEAHLSESESSEEETDRTAMLVAESEAAVAIARSR